MAFALTASLMLGACAQQDNAEPGRTALPPVPPAVGGSGLGTGAGAAVPARATGPVDTGEVGGMRAKPAIPADAAGNPPQP
jgi:hypothetical protein